MALNKPGIAMQQAAEILSCRMIARKGADRFKVLVGGLVGVLPKNLTLSSVVYAVILDASLAVLIIASTVAKCFHSMDT